MQVTLNDIGRDERLELVDAHGVVVAHDVRLALGPWSRLRGLLGAAPLERGEALLLRPCRGVHTFFMRYSIDVVFVDREGRIVALFSALRPWRSTGFVVGSVATIELAAGAIAAASLSVGEIVIFRRRQQT